MDQEQQNESIDMESWNTTCVMMNTSVLENKLQQPETHHPKQKVVEWNKYTAYEVNDVY
jgi:hypothetical protein